MHGYPGMWATPGDDNAHLEMPNLQRATIPKSYAAKFNSKQISARLQKDEMQDSARDLLRSKIYNQCDDGPKTVDRCASVHWRWMENCGSKVSQHYILRRSVKLDVNTHAILQSTLAFSHQFMWKPHVCIQALRSKKGVISGCFFAGFHVMTCIQIIRGSQVEQFMSCHVMTWQDVIMLNTAAPQQGKFRFEAPPPKSFLINFVSTILVPKLSQNGNCFPLRLVICFNYFCCLCV